MAFYYDPAVGHFVEGSGPGSSSSSSGLDPRNLSYNAGNPSGVTYTQSPGGPVPVYGVGTNPSTTYSGPGGTFTNYGGAWTGAGGEKIGDLPGYLQMRERMKSGAGFEPYQNQLTQLMTNPSAIQETPGYKFALEQGNQAINRSAAAKGALNSGGVLSELAKYGQGMASQEYGNQVNRLTDLMRGAQQFGVQAGYYRPPQNVQFSGTSTSNPSTW